MKIKICPLSVNKAWQGRRFSTPAKKAFEQEFYLLLPKKIDIPDGELVLEFEWGFSNYALSDYDNPIKTAQDVICKKYNFNDRRIKRGIQTKEKVNKGEEYIKFKISKFIK